MRRRALFWCAFSLTVLSFTSAWAEEAVDLDMVTRIRAEGFERSQVMETLSHLTEEIGSRLTGSPAMKEANDWTRSQLEKWGLANARLEGYDFGRGWTFSRVSVRMLAPRETQLSALPMAWTAATEGPVRGAAVRLDLADEKDLEEHKGKLAGKILLSTKPRDAEEPESEPDFRRHDAKGLEELESFEIRDRPPGEELRRNRVKRWKFRKALVDFLLEEKVVAVVELSSRDHGLIRVGAGGSWDEEDPHGLPGVTMAAEHYNHLVRLLDDGQEVELEIDVAARFHDGPTSYNTVAEIPGTDKRGEVVMLGAHLDSWHAGTGATDNAAGVAVMMEAMRILKTLGVKPRRTLRIALWSGEEQGLLGSTAYVREHFASRPASEDPEQLKLPERIRDATWPLQLEPEHGKLAAYFNVDNGGGKIRGIYSEENAGVRPIFAAWLAPLHDLGADTVTLRRTGGTDHQAFDRVGIPGFQFIQDPMDYTPRTHHTHVDTLDHVHKKDLMQASVVVATFAYHAAMRPEILPRKPLPQEPPKKEEKKKEEAEPGA